MRLGLLHLVGIVRSSSNVYGYRIYGGFVAVVKRFSVVEKVGQERSAGKVTPGVNLTPG